MATGRRFSRFLVLGLVVVVELWNGLLLSNISGGVAGSDWRGLTGLSLSNPYAAEWLKWSLPAAWFFPLIAPIGFLAWQLLHAAALVLVRDWRVVALVVVSFPFWGDVLNGNVLTFVFVAAWLAVRGSRTGVIAFCVLAAFIPRPIMLPVLVWLLWRRPDARIAFGGAATVAIGLGLATGTLGTWIAHMLAAPGYELTATYNIGPSSVLGSAWLLIGIPLCMLALRRGWLGLASVACAPYLIHYYALMAFLDAPRALGWIGPRLFPSREVRGCAPLPDPHRPAEPIVVLQL